MKFTRRLMFAAALLLAAAMPGSASDGAQAKEVASGDGRYYVHPKDGTSLEQLAQAVELAGGTIEYRFKLIDALTIQVNPQAYGALREHPALGLIEEVPTATLAFDVVPYTQYQTQAIHAWDADGNGQVDPHPIDGRGIKVCVIDSGLFRAHDDFAGLSITGSSQILLQAWSTDGLGHGTHVAGIIAGALNATGAIGISPGAVSLHIVKVFDNNGEWGAFADLARAAENCWEAGANVINMSLGMGTTSSPTITAVMERLHHDQNVLLVAAAGNSTPLPNAPTVPRYTDPAYPANEPSVVAVAAIDDRDNASDFTQHPPNSEDPINPPADGSWKVVEVAAGGVAVPSAYPTTEFTVSGTSYQVIPIEGSPVGRVTALLQEGGFCLPTDVVPAWRDKIVVCSRGTITFTEKIANAATAGAKGVVIYNNVPGLFGGTCSGACPGAIPALSISDVDGQRLIAAHLGQSAEIVAPVAGVAALDGTSMASPTVAGSAALVWQACGGPDKLDASQLRLLLRDSAQDLQGVHPGSGIAYGAGYDRVTGWGSVKVMDAIALGASRFGERCFNGLQVQPNRLDICRAGGAASANVTATLAYRNNLDLSLSSLPAGASFAFSPATLFGGNNASTLTVNAGTAQRGQYDLLLTAADPMAPPGVVARAALPMSIADAAPGSTPSLQSPASAATRVGLRPSLQWLAVVNASAYRIQISEHADFRVTTHDTVTADAAYIPTPALAGGRTYYWRVAARNGCGDSAFSTPRVFSTEPFQCVVSGAAIPEGGSASSSLTFTAPGVASQVDVMVQLTHPRMGDVRLTLEHVESGRSVRLLNDPKRGQIACEGSDMDALLMDGAPVSADLACQLVSPSLSGELAPTDALSMFAGADQRGTWKLSAGDAVANTMSGSLESWCIALGSSAPVVNGAVYLVDEHAPLGTVVGRVIATDPDAGDQSSFSVVGGSGASAFGVDGATGDVSVIDPNAIDYERASTHDLLVQARDQSGNVGIGTLTIHVLDVDEPPRFDRQAFSVREDAIEGFVLGQVAAVDPEGDVSLVYRVRGGAGAPHIKIDGTSGALAVKSGADLDHESVALLDLLIEVADSRGNVFLGSVDIQVLDVNEPPRLLDATFAVEENAPAGHPVGQIPAADMDAQDSHDFKILHSPDGNRFSINSDGELMVAVNAQLDFETLGACEIDVEVTDGVGGVDTRRYRINLIDANEAPVFAALHTVGVSEDSPAGSEVLRAQAMDPDVGDVLLYQIESGNDDGLFELDGGTGALHLRPGQMLDFERRAVHTLVLRATDRNGLFGSGTVRIRVTDVNEAPTLAAGQVFQIPEIAGAGHVAGSLVATDPDQGDALTYRAVGGSGSSVFEVDAASGAVRLRAGVSLDFETTPSYVLDVEVTDSAGLSATGSVTIQVTNANEAPSLAAGQVLQVAESAVGGHVLGSLVASDPDQGDALTYRAVGGSGSSVFEMDAASGAVRLRAGVRLDFETTPSYVLDVEVTDSAGLSATGTVTIQVTDANEAPQLAALQSLAVYDRSPPGFTLGRVAANDPDIGDTISFQLVAGGAGLFELDAASGDLSVAPGASLLGRAGQQLALEVRVTDQLGLNNTGTVTIMILRADLFGDGFEE